MPDVGAYLLGAWTLERDLVDRTARLVGAFRGTTTFRTALEPGPPELVPIDQHEDGELTWAGAVRHAERASRIHPRAGGTALVRFTDGRAFHELDLRTGTFLAHHLCAKDLYTGTFTIVSADEWRVRWDVAGPGKDQTFTSCLRRS